MVQLPASIGAFSLKIHVPVLSLILEALFYDFLSFFYGFLFLLLFYHVFPVCFFNALSYSTILLLYDLTHDEKNSWRPYLLSPLMRACTSHCILIAH